MDSTGCVQELWQQASGSGPPALLLHGLGASAHYWDEVLARDTGKFMVAPDLLGFGRSPAPPDAPYDVACHVASLAPLLQPGTVVVGHSTGSILAAALAAAFPDKVRALVLVSTPVYPDEATARAEIGRIGLLARLTIEGSVWARVVCEAMCHARPVAVAAAPWLFRGLPRAVAADGARHTWPSYSRTLKEVVACHPVADELRGSDVPVTFLHGSQDPIADPARAEALAASLDSSRQVEFRRVDFRYVDCDHHLPLKHPDAVVAAIAAT